MTAGAKVKPFTAFVQELRRGKVAVELSEKLAEVVHAVGEHHAPGSLSLTIKFKPDGDGQLTVQETITCKVPEAQRAPSIFFADEDGNLSRNPPGQLEIGDQFRDVIGDRRDQTAPSAEEASA
jgi:hypothetical protein